MAPSQQAACHSSFIKKDKVLGTLGWPWTLFIAEDDLESSCLHPSSAGIYAGD